MQTSPQYQALIKKRKAEVALIPPPPGIRKIKRPNTVLDEDRYLDGLSHIIARDYFPGLAATEAKRDFLAALDSKDESWIQETGSRLTQMLDGKIAPGRRRPGSADMTPRALIPGIYVPLSDSSQVPAQVDVNTNLGLAAYQAKYTSEDNESFNALIDKQNHKNREKHAWLWNQNQIPSARQIAWREREARLIEASKSSMDLAIFRKDTRPAMPTIKQAAPKNSFMFVPDSVEDRMETVTQAAEAKSNAPPKAIIHANTRLEFPITTTAHQIPPSPSLSAINNAVAGRPQLNRSEAGCETPQVDGYAFVDAVPTAAELLHYNRPAAVLPPAGSDPAAILARLTKSGTGENPFDIREANKREQLHHKLVDRAKGSKIRAQIDRFAQLPTTFTPVLSAKTATPKFMSAPKKQAESLTPAGQLLYAKMKQRPSAGRTSTPITDFQLTPNVSKAKKGSLPGVTPRTSSKLAGR